MFTGTPPALHGVESDFETIDPKTPVLTELLRDAGYSTAGVFTVRYLWGDYGFQRGFDTYRNAIFEEDLTRRDSGRVPDGAEVAQRLGMAEGADMITSPRVVQLARMALERADPSKPVFLFAHFFDPHHDYVPPPPWDTAFDPGYEGDIDGRGYLSNRRIVDPSKNPIRQIGDRDLEHIESLYRGEIAWTDRWVGELLDLFALHKRLDDTLIVITSDHGEAFFEHGFPGHRVALFDELVRIPLLIVPPKAKRKRLREAVEGQVGLSDLMPTILDFAEIPVPSTVRGRSLRTAMYGEPLTPRPQLLSIYRAKGPSQEFVSLVQAVRTPGFKLKRELIFLRGGPADLNYYYFDLIDDPLERRAITDPNDPRVRKARSLLASELDDVRARWSSEARSPDAERRTNVRDTFAEQLMALGYVEAGAESDPDRPPRPWGSLAPMKRIEPAETSARSWALAGLGLLAAALLLAWVRRTRGRR
jgi:arylsulfatase A-like enzyme